MADHSKPLVTSTYTNFVTELDGRFDDIAKGLDPATTTPTNLPTGSIRWNSASSKWEKWSGTAWADLAASYNINLSGPLTLTANSSSDALRITQTGAGNCLVVEDSANPDSTPFVIDANGSVVVGNTVSVDTGIQTTSGNVFVQKLGTSVNNRWGASLGYWQNNTQAMRLNFAKSRGTAVGTNASVASGDLLGQVEFKGDDGAGFIEAASISSYVDGTPGTNDMPGRLVFSTTADGDSSPTERMRIRSDGNIGLGGSGSGAVSFYNQKAITGGATSYGNYINSTVQSDVTTYGIGNRTALSTAAASFSTSLFCYWASQGTIGAGSSVTNQYGFYTDAALTGATNNYGFYSSIAAGTGRWNFYAGGTAYNYFAGATTIGNPTPNALLGITPNFQVEGVGSSSSAIGVIRDSNDTLGPTIRFAKSRGTTVGSATIVAADDSLGFVNFNGADGTQFVQAAQISAAVDGTPGTNDMPGRLVFSTAADGASTPTERMRISQHGGVSIGGSGSAQVGLYNQRNISGNATSYANLTLAFVQSDVTSNAYGYRTDIGTAAASFTAGSIQHFSASQTTFGAGSTVTNQYGFSAENDLTGATNNYGFYSNIASGTGRWNFYAAGTAYNYFAGRVGVGTTDPQAELSIEGNLYASIGTNSASNAPTQTFYRRRIGGASVISGDSLGLLTFSGLDGTGAIPAAQISAAVDGTPGTNDMPGRLVFSTTADGASSPTERMRIASDGQVTLSANAGLTISKTAVTAPAASDGNVFSGTYTPTLTNVTNIDLSTARTTQYMRVGNVVTVSGRVTIDATTSGTYLIFRMSLPVASNIAAAENGAGTFRSGSNAHINAGIIYATSATDDMTFSVVAETTAANEYYFHFTYRVI